MNLRFKPVHSGLGFHPFENGLPYAPAQSKALQKRPLPVSNHSTPNLSAPNLSNQVPTETLSTPISVFSKWGALFLDTLLLAGVSSLVLLVVLFSQGISLTSLTRGYSPLFVALYYIVFHFCVLTAQEILTRTSLGKAFFGLELDGDAVQILFRSAPVKHQ